MLDEQLTINTGRLVLRPFHPDDADQVKKIIKMGAHPTALPPGAPAHPAGVGAWLAHGVHELWRSGQGIHLAMRADGGIVGSISLFRADWDARTAEVGYGVHPAHRGRGYATEAVRALADRLLGEGVLRRMELRANSDNVASVRVAEKAGFVREGLLRGACYEQDGPYDLVVFGRLRDDRPVVEDRRLESERLVLRPYTRGDALDVLEAARNDAEMRRWLPWTEGYTLEKAIEWCTRLAHPTRPGHCGDFAIESRAEGRLAGGIGVRNEDRERGHAEVGYWIAPWARRRGYAVEATRMITAHLFRQGFHRVHLLIATGNHASQAVARRAGFTEEGILRQALPVPGGRADAVLFGMLRGEFS